MKVHCLILYKYFGFIDFYIEYGENTIMEEAIENEIVENEAVEDNTDSSKEIIIKVSLGKIPKPRTYN